MRDYDREWFTLEGREIEMLAAGSPEDPSADIRVIFQWVIGTSRPPARRWLAGSPRRITRTNKGAPGRGAISPQDRRSGRTLRGSGCSILAASWGGDWVVPGAGVTDRGGVRR